MRRVQRIAKQHHVAVRPALVADGRKRPPMRGVGHQPVTVQLVGPQILHVGQQLGLAEMRGGSFTISNLGGIGGTNFTPIVNWPEVAILGVARSSYEPVHIDGQFQPRMIMPYALSYDHRVIDGADGARFTRFIDEALQNPMLLTLEG